MIENSGYRRIIQSTSIIAGSSIINIIFSLIRMKFAAIILGPAGIGLIGLIQTFITTFVSIISMGVPQAGIRIIAIADKKGNSDLLNAKKALFLVSAIMGVLGILISLLFERYISELFFKNTYYTDSIIWLGIGVSLTLFSSSLVALLNGLGEIKLIAKITIINALISLVAGVIVLYGWGNNGLLVFVLIGPVANFMVAGYFVNKLNLFNIKSLEGYNLLPGIKKILHAGIGLMFIGIAWSGAHLMIRSEIQNKLGIIELGYFQASWTIGTFYLSFILNGLGSDYYPRLSAILTDHKESVKLINNQTEITILLTGPILFFALSTAPWIIELLYSKEFILGTELLRWQILSDVLKVITWPISYYILASGDRRTYLLTEILSIVIFLIFSIVLLPYYGIKSIGISSTVLFICILPASYKIAYNNIGFKWDNKVFKYVLSMILSFFFIFTVGFYSINIASILGIIFSLIFSIYSFKKLFHVYNILKKI